MKDKFIYKWVYGDLNIKNVSYIISGGTPLSIYSVNKLDVGYIILFI